MWGLGGVRTSASVGRSRCPTTASKLCGVSFGDKSYLQLIYFSSFLVCNHSGILYGLVALAGGPLTACRVKYYCSFFLLFHCLL